MEYTLIILIAALAVTAQAGYKENPYDDATVVSNATDIATLEGRVDGHDADVSALDNVQDRHTVVIGNNALSISMHLARSAFGIQDYIFEAFADTNSIDAANSSNWSYDAGGDYVYSEAVEAGVDLTDAIIAQYHMDDDAASTVVLDAQGSNNGTLAGGDNTEDLQEAGKLGGAIHFDGSADYISLSALSDDLTMARGAVTFWAYTDDNPVLNECWWGIGVDAADKIYSMFVYNTDRYRIAYNDGSYQFDLQSDTDDADDAVGAWQFYVFQHDGTEPAIFVENVDEGNNWNNQTDKTYWWNDIAGAGWNMGIGARYAVGAFSSFYDGLIDEVMIFERNLTSDERDHLYNSGTGTTNLLGASTGGNATIQSVAYSTATNYTSAIVLLSVTNAVTGPTNSLIYLSQDGGTNWSDAIVCENLEYAAGPTEYVWSGEGTFPSSYSGGLVYKIVETNNPAATYKGLAILPE